MPINPISSLELNTILSKLERYIVYIFDHQDEFAKEFCHEEIMDLVNVSFTTHTCKIVYILDCGQHVCDSIQVDRIYDWIDNQGTYETN